MRAWLALAFVSCSALAAPAEDPKADPKPPEGWNEFKGGFKKQAYVVWLPPGGKLDETMSSILTKYGQVRIYRPVSAGILP